MKIERLEKLMYWLKVGFWGERGMIDVAKKKREINKNSPKYKYIWKREKFGYLLGIARGVWGIQNGKWNRMSRLFQTSSNRTQLFKFSWSWQRGLGIKRIVLRYMILGENT